MEPQLLSLGEWQELLQNAGVRERRRGELLIGTIVDVLQLVEQYKKAGLDAAFGTGWAAIADTATGVLCDGTLQVLGLDQDGLLDALFDGDRHGCEDEVGLWPPCTERDVPPWRALRRLILRPTENRWWDPEVYDAMEAMYREEPRWDG